MGGITADQLRAARGLVGLSQEQVAEAAKVGRATIADFESGKREPYAQTLEDLRAALEANGVEFTNGGQPGVRKRENFLRIVGKPPKTRPLRMGDKVKFRPGKAHDRFLSDPSAIGLVSWIEPYPIEVGPVPRIKVRFGDNIETSKCLPSDFDFA